MTTLTQGSSYALLRAQGGIPARTLIMAFAVEGESVTGEARSLLAGVHGRRVVVHVRDLRLVQSGPVARAMGGKAMGGTE